MEIAVTEIKAHRVGLERKGQIDGANDVQRCRALE